MIGSSLAGKELVEAAKRKNIYTIVTDNCSIEESSFPIEADERWIIDSREIDVLEKLCRKNGVTGITNGISLFNRKVAAELSQRLDLPYYCTLDSLKYSTDKAAFKKLCEENGVPVAKSYHVSANPTQEELERIELPVVVKAVDQCSNKGMSYCHTREELLPAIEYARSVSKHENVIIEKFLTGAEYYVHYAMVNGEASMFGLLSELAQPGEPENLRPISTTVTDCLPLFLKEVDPYLKKLLYNGNMHNGVAWFEMMMDDDGHLYVLEMGYRLSGNMMELGLKNMTGFDSYEWLVDMSMGVPHTSRDLPVQQTKQYPRCGCSYLIWSNETSGVVGSITGVDLLEEDPNMHVVCDVRIGIEYDPHDYLITFVFDSESPEAMCRKIEEINSKVKILDTEGNNIAVYFTDFDAIYAMRDRALQQEQRKCSITPRLASHPVL